MPTALHEVLVFSLDPPLVKLTDFGLVATAGQERFQDHHGAGLYHTCIYIYTYLYIYVVYIYTMYICIYISIFF